MHIVQPNFDGREIDLISMYFFLPDFDGQLIDVASIFLFNALSLYKEWKQLDVLILIFLTDKKCGPFNIDISFDTFLIYQKLKMFGRLFAKKTAVCSISGYFENSYSCIGFLNYFIAMNLLMWKSVHKELK